MAKALLIIVILIFAIVAAVMFKASRLVEPSAKPLGSSKALEEAEAELRNVPVVTAKKIQAGAQAVGKAAALLETKITALKLDREVVEVAAGGKTDFKVTRSGSTKAAKLDLLPAPASGLTAGGGVFKDGQTETTVTVQAPPDAHDAALTIKAGDVVKLVPVKVTGPGR